MSVEIICTDHVMFIHVSPEHSIEVSISIWHSNSPKTNKRLGRSIPSISIVLLSFKGIKKVYLVALLRDKDVN